MIGNIKALRESAAEMYAAIEYIESLVRTCSNEIELADRITEIHQELIDLLAKARGEIK